MRPSTARLYRCCLATLGKMRLAVTWIVSVLRALGDGTSTCGAAVCGTRTQACRRRAGVQWQRRGQLGRTVVRYA